MGDNACKAPWLRVALGAGILYVSLGESIPYDVVQVKGPCMRQTPYFFLLLCAFGLQSCSSSQPAAKEDSPEAVQQAPVKAAATTTPKTYKDGPCANPDWARLPPGMEPPEDPKTP